MKKLILIAIIAILPAIGMSQGMIWKKFISSATVAASANYTITTSGVYSSWSAFFKIGTATVTTSTVKVQVSPDGVEWIDYSGLPAVTIVSATPVAFEDDFVSFRWMRFVFTITAGDVIPVTGWYVFKN